MKTDMSPHAVTLRLKLTSDLRDLCISLGKNSLQDRIRIRMERAQLKSTGSIEDYRGFFKGFDASFERDENDRY